MLSIKHLTGVGDFYSHSDRFHAPLVRSSLAIKKTPTTPLRYKLSSENPTKIGDDSVVQDQDQRQPKGGGDNQGAADGDDKGIAGIHVPRQRYISVPKAELLEALLALFESKDGADEFARFSMCLDSILHAEHKDMLEDMRLCYSVNQSQDQKTNASNSSVRTQEDGFEKHHFSVDDSLGVKEGTEIYRKFEDDKPLCLHSSLDFRNFFGFSPGLAPTNSVTESRVAAATHFQHSFMKLLNDAEFEELSVQDLQLTYALNSDYLLTLPVYVDWKRASQSKAIIFRRGYATEKQTGLLIVEKLDYLQSKLLQGIFFNLSRPLKQIGSWIDEALRNSSEVHELQIWIEKVKLWLKEKYIPESSWSSGKNTNNKQKESNQIADTDLPIWLAAQKAVPRYEGLLSSVGPRGRLVRKLLTWVGIIPSMPEDSMSLENDLKYSETYLRPNFLPRITLGNIWAPATRESCGNNVWKMLKASLSILFSRSTLQEPAFQELILLYASETSETEINDGTKSLPLQLKIYEKIPIPDLQVIFPHKKLSFRIIDTVRLDIASILGLSAYFVNYKFENIISSPSAVFLDVIAASALVLYVTRIVLGYKQTWDRYQLLVNRTLYEKTIASGFGSVYFLLDASEQQQYKEAILAYAFLLHSKKYQVSCRISMTDACERFMYDSFKEKIEMPVEKALDTLLRLDLVTEFPDEEKVKLKALPCSKACEILRKRWNGLLGQKT